MRHALDCGLCCGLAECDCMTILPYVYDYPVLADYMKAMKPYRAGWDLLHRDSEFRSPADEWQWCWSQPEAQECANS